MNRTLRNGAVALVLAGGALLANAPYGPAPYAYYGGPAYYSPYYYS